MSKPRSPPPINGSGPQPAAPALGGRTPAAIARAMRGVDRGDRRRVTSAQQTAARGESRSCPTCGACDAAYTAPYLHEPWSLPCAFLLAGARGVLAPATLIPDQEAGGFFRAVGDRILRGVDPAVVLRDQRMARRGGATDWVNSVVRFD